jgi:hypothetical protein
MHVGVYDLSFVQWFEIKQCVGKKTARTMHNTKCLKT